MPGLTSAEDLIRQIHKSPRKLVVATTGGGASAIGQLLAIPGGSGTVLEGIVPYSSESLTEFLHGRPEQFCSATAARAMAMAAFQRARHLNAIRVEADPGAGPADYAIVWLFGIGCTASLLSDYPKRGSHRIHVAAQCSFTTCTDSLELVKGRRSRPEEEEIASKMVLNMIAKYCGVGKRLELPWVENEAVESRESKATQQWRDLLVGERSAVEHPLPVSPASERQPHGHQGPRGIFPGAFNPLHRGHIQMAEVAARRIGGPVEFEISIENVDKLPLNFTEMEDRAAQFSDKSLSLWFTRAPTFDEKSKLFPGCTFIVGADTIARIGQCRYYHDDPAAMGAAFAGMAERGCRFLVFGRMANGKFESLAELQIPMSLRKLCDDVPASEFREDISSTELRGKPIDD